MGDLFWHRLQFGFTITFHYIFPQLTMGLALLIVVLKGVALRTRSEAWNDAARFWIRIFGLSFAMGVVTGIPMEFQFGTNWAAFAHKTGGVIGQTLAMEGLFAFFFESSFLALLVFGERRLGPRYHFLAAWALFVGSWLSAYFIVATNAFMQYPAGYAIAEDGTFQIARLSEFVFSPWAVAQFLLFVALAARPLAWLAVAVFLAGLAVSFFARRGGRDLPAFLGSCAFLFGMLLATAAAVFPLMIRSSSAPERSLTAKNAAAGPESLAAGLGWWPAGFLLATVYVVILFRLHRGKVRASADDAY